MSRVFMLFTCVLSAGAMASDQQGVYYESFEDGVPAYFAATRAKSLSLSPWHSKHGKKSLRWDWSKGEELVIRHGIGDVARRGGLNNNNRASFAVWVYVEEPISGALVFEFREAKRVTGFFRFPLAFTGWRQARIFYHDFPSGKPTAEVDNIRIVAPRRVVKGAVFLDLIKYNTLTYKRRAVIPEKEAEWRRPVPDERRFPKPDRVTEAELAGIRKLLGPDGGSGVSETRVKNVCEKVKALGIVRDERGVRGGPGIDGFYHYVSRVGEGGAEKDGYWRDELGRNWPPGIESHWRITHLASQVAGRYRASRDAEQRRRLAEAFLLIEDHLYDQGMQAGSGFKCNWQYGSNLADAVFMMRDVLAKAGRLARQRDYLLYNYGGGRIFAEADPPSSMDYYRFGVPRLLRAGLIQVEATEQVRWLNAFKAMLERSILQPTSSLKIDGCTYHHSGHYFAYGSSTIPELASTVQQLSDTPWRLSTEAHERIRRAALAQRIFCNQLDVPLSLSGRKPFEKSSMSIRPKGLDVLARCGTPDGKQAIDLEVAGAYLRLVPEAVNKEPYRSLGIEPEPEPNGTFVMPYAALLSHRRDNWLASVHGQSKYVWGSERQGKVNCFGLFQGLGHIEILAGGNPVSASASGRQELGWDWRRFEGTTVPQVPLEKIGKEKWNLPRSPETFVGGLSQQGRQGIFAMILNQAMSGKKRLKGRKSWFFSDNCILCMGSNISCKVAQYPTQTTLCQKSLPKNEKGEFLTTCLDGTDFTDFPKKRRLGRKGPHWFLDVQQTGYYLPAGQKVTVARRHQESRDHKDLRDTEGDFLTAWIDHGKVPRAASYEYLLVVRTTPRAMQRLVTKLSYRVIQRDQDAHIVWFPASRRWGCVFFVPQKVTPHTVATKMLPIKRVGRPCLIMAKAVRGGQLAVSVADPDLNLEKTGTNRNCPAVSRPRPLRIALRGAWRPLAATGTVCAWRLPDVRKNIRILSTSAEATVLEILCRHGASYDIRFAR